MILLWLLVCVVLIALKIARRCVINALDRRDAAYRRVKYPDRFQ